ncbi:MAG: single-stranded DNA-binding protein [Oxalobacter sp.]|nr:single-stranded DNA-binding protein [Oxalobacter sp.]
MASINKVIIVGNLGRDPESRYSPNGEQVTRVSIATTDARKDRQTGERIENTEWHRVVFFGKLAEIAGQYLKKGSQVYVEGRLRTSKYTGKDGIERYSTDIIAEQMQMLGSRQGSGDPVGGYDGGFQQSAPRQGAAKPQPSQGGGLPPNIPMDDDIPF